MNRFTIYNRLIISKLAMQLDNGQRVALGRHAGVLDNNVRQVATQKT